MSAVPNEFFGRRASLLVTQADDALDLTELHFTFSTKQEDEESPNNCSIRVYNLSGDTVTRIQGEFNKVVLQAGYQSAPFGVIFQGTIKQFRVGKESPTSTYLDILACDGDVAYNWATLNRTLAAGSNPEQRVSAVIDAMKPKGVEAGQVLIPGTGGILPRGKVLWGLARDALRQGAASQGCTWNISDGKVNVVPLDGYLPGEAVVLTSATGLLGRPEQTQEGVRARCLLNPRIRTGALVKIDNQSINRTFQQGDFSTPGAQLAYDKYVGLEMFADVTADGLYRCYVAEHRGDTRGQEWYTDLILLAVDPVTLKVKPFA
jgi:hypothetical protein